MAVTPTQRHKFYEARIAGFSRVDASKIAGFSLSTGNRLDEASKKIALTKGDGTIITYRERKLEAGLSGPIARDHLSAEAQRALDDFGYFRLRYFGRMATPWQEEAAYAILASIETDVKEYIVLNCPPGSGKTTLIHDVICWLICRNRSIRILVGSATEKQAQRILGRVRRSLERVVPELAKDEDKRNGSSFDAQTTMALDFGRFRPIDKELWSAVALVVMQPEEKGAITEKEPTLSSYGRDGGVLGERYNFAVWDDLVDVKSLRSPEQREVIEDWYQDVCEARLEPGGCHVLVGQRLSADDLYRFALDMTQPLDDDLLDDMNEDEIAQLRRDKKYKHLKYKAHYEENCLGAETHKRASAPYPTGCLLDPRRISWRDISNLMSNRGERFEVVYQQEDIAPDEVLVRSEWVYGGDGFLGCIDHDRDSWQIPEGLQPSECLVVATVDPSPTLYWSVQLWIVDPTTERRHLIELLRKKMEASAFLQYNISEGRLEGVMEDWQRTSESLGFPINYWIFERNAAQRWLLQFDHFHKWQQKWGVEVIQHDTTSNKLDPNYGVTSISQHWKYGRVRLMGKGEGKLHSLKLIEEVTRYPYGTRTDDCVMGEWFLEWNLPNLAMPRRTRTHAWRPSWAQKITSKAWNLN